MTGCPSLEGASKIPRELLSFVETNTNMQLPILLLLPAVVILAATAAVADDTSDESKAIAKFELLRGKVTRDDTLPSRSSLRHSMKPPETRSRCIDGPISPWLSGRMATLNSFHPIRFHRCQRRKRIERAHKRRRISDLDANPVMRFPSWHRAVPRP